MSALTRTPFRRRRIATVILGVAGTFVLASPAVATTSTTQVIADPFTNSTSQHATAVEPDTFAFGGTIVTASQTGRFFDGGSSDIGYSTSTDGGKTFTGGSLPGITKFAGGTFDRVSDASVAYDAKHGVWLISTIPIKELSGGGVNVPEVAVNRSTDGGLTFGGPVTVATGQDLDKNWTVCDNTPTSPHFGNCYTEYDDNAQRDLVLMSTSTDGGQTWSAPQTTADRATGLGGQPVVQPNGTVIVPAANASESKIISFTSTDGGASWGKSTVVSSSRTHTVADNLRTSPLPSAEIDGSGKVYVAWQDCRFRQSCASNDIVLTTSTDGQSWSAVSRIPIDATTSGVDHFIPGLAVDPSTSGTGAHLALTYYFYANAACGSACQLQVGYVGSGDGGATWSSPTQLAGPFGVNLTPNTSQGNMVGDYISTSWVATSTGNRAFGAFAIASPGTTQAFNQAIFVPTGGLSTSGAAANPVGQDPELSTDSDHPDATTAHSTR